MTFREWINNLIGVGLLCCDYTSRVNSALSKKQLADIGLDANGISYIARMAQKGYPLPYNSLLKEFKNFINGNYIFESVPNERGYSYTSEVYVCYSDNDHVDVKTTLVAFLGCKTKINIQERTIVNVYLDKNCEVEINCPLSSRCRVYLYGDAKVVVLSNEEKVKVIKVDENEE